MRGLCLTLLIFIANSSSVANAFFHHIPFTTRVMPSALLRPKTHLYMKSGPHPMDEFDEQDNNNNNDGFDVEAVRQRLENLLVSSGGTTEGGGSSRLLDAPTSPPRFAAQKRPSLSYSLGDSSNTEIDVILPPPPPLTAIERARREAELELLDQLRYGDESLSDLWTFWFQERGQEAAARLLKAEELTGQGPKGWGAAEELLRELIEEYGVYWAEPVNRLATLYYMQGKFEEAETLCKMVLAVKPWHFGALSGIVMVFASMHDSQSARQWAARRLPTFAPSGPNRRREAWVQKAVMDAEESLLAAEERVREAFGKPDDCHFANKGQLDTDMDEDAWQ